MTDIKTLWDIYTSKEEYNPIIRDQWDRTPYYISKNRDVLTPVVSEYLFNNGFKPCFPDKKKFCVVLTHDVDMIYDNHIKFKTFAKDIIKNFNFNFGDIIKSYYSKLNQTYNKEWHLNNTFMIEKKYNANSSFYFLARQKGDIDFNYTLKQAKPLFEIIKQNHGEIGLHGSLFAYKDGSKIAKEKKELEISANQPIKGYRNHVLKFNTPLTWDLLKKNEFEYDTTFGYGSTIGFRNGMCYPFQPYNLNNNNFIDILEMPLNIMDVSLFHQYMRLSDDTALKLCKQLIDKVAKLNGVVTILWHNNFMLGKMGAFYEELLKYASEKNAWLTSASELNNWWTEQNYHKKLNKIISDKLISKSEK